MPRAKNAVQMLVQPTRYDFEQLAAMPKAQIQAEIVKLGADYHPAETKPDLAARLMQLQGTAQPIDKLRKEMAAHGVGEDGLKTDAIPIQTARLTKEQILKAIDKYIKKGLEFRVSKDGSQWAMRFKCEQARQDGKVVQATRVDTGNTMIPLGVVVRCAESITTYTPIKKKDAADASFGAGFDEEEETAA